MKNKDWSYLAGLFDGEGCIHIAEVTYRDRPYGLQLGYRLDMHITMTSREIVESLVREFGGVYYHQPAQNAKWNDAYRWVPKGKRNKEELLLGLLPKLRIQKKHEAAKIALEFLRLEGICPEARKELSDKCRLLTRRGKSLETNTLGSEQSEMIESELQGDLERAPLVTAVA